MDYSRLAVLQLSVLHAIFLCKLLLLVIDSHAAIFCPNVFIEKGDTYVISCKSDETLVDFYWYRGMTSRSTPILRLESGQKGGSEEGNDHYEILSNGSMKLKNATVDQESYYTFVGYYDSANFDSQTFLVNITISPDPPCPQINHCNNCNTCHIKAEKRGSLTCSVTRARPFVPLIWNVVDQTEISFTKRQDHEVPDDRTSPLNTTISLDYSLHHPCGGHAVVQCVSKGSSHILESNVSTVNITSDPCIPPTSSPTVNKFVYVILVAAISSVVVCCLCCWRKCSKKKAGNGNKKKGIYMKVLETKEDKEEFLRSSLREAYKRHCYVKPLPWGEDISISVLYTDCECTITYNDETIKHTTTKDLLSLQRINKEERVIFVGDLGYGKTTFTKKMVHQWIQDKANKHLLIYVLLKDVRKEMMISDIVMKELPKDYKISVVDIEEAMKENSCLIILDGLDEMSLSVDGGMTSAATDSKIKSVTGECDNSLTIGELLQGFKKQTYTDMRVWVTSREVDNAKSPFPKPYSKVQMSGFSKDQIKTYITKCCSYYISLGDITTNPETPATESNTSSQGLNEEILLKEDNEPFNEEKTGSEGETIADRVKEFFETNNIFDDFGEAPLLLILMVHIMSAKYTGAISNYSTLVITRVSTLVGMVITCLEARYVQKLNKKMASKKIAYLEDKLGKVAFEGDVKLSLMERNFWLENGIQNDDLQTALGIGLLKQSKSKGSGNKAIQSLAYSSFTGIEFYHQCIQEYFAARYIVNNRNTFSKLEKMIEKYKTGQSFGLLKFVSGLENAPIEKICNLLIKKKMFNNLIDCLYEASVHNLDDKIFQKVDGHYIEVVNLDEKYHRDAVRAFCKQCRKHQIPLKSITFFEDCHVWFLKTLHLPQLECLKFFGARFTDADFEEIIKFLSSQKVTKTLWFLECEIPEKLDVLKNSILDFKNSGITIHRKKVGKDVTFSTFDYKCGEWKIGIEEVLSAPKELLFPNK